MFAIYRSVNVLMSQKRSALLNKSIPVRCRGPSLRNGVPETQL